ncbi:protein serine/threonine phosphatase [Aureococcus anophagefferens]|nr:protein serine/threonine phosphatase [Aureococcus anophagefferens]
MGVYLSRPDTRKESESGDAGNRCEYGASSMQGWRKGQEDAHIAADVGGTAVFGVFDGHGGREVSNFTAKHCAATLTSQPSFGTNLGSALAGAFHGIDMLLEDPSNYGELEASSGTRGPSSAPAAPRRRAPGRRRRRRRRRPHPHLRGPSQAARAQRDAASMILPRGENQVCRLPDSPVTAGATSVVAAVRGDTVIVANAGDSRAVLCRKGVAVPLSEDHKPANAGESERILAAGGFVTAQGRVNGNLNLSRSPGDLKYKGNKALGRDRQMITAEPDIAVHTLVARDDEFMVLACDGVWDVLSNQECVDFVRERIGTTPPAVIAEQIFDRCIADDPKTTQGIGGDNMTAVIVKFNWAS